MTRSSRLDGSSRPSELGSFCPSTATAICPVRGNTENPLTYCGGFRSSRISLPPVSRLWRVSVETWRAESNALYVRIFPSAENVGLAPNSPQLRPSRMSDREPDARSTRRRPTELMLPSGPTPWAASALRSGYHLSDMMAPGSPVHRVRVAPVASVWIVTRPDPVCA